MVRGSKRPTEPTGENGEITPLTRAETRLRTPVEIAPRQNSQLALEKNGNEGGSYSVNFTPKNIYTGVGLPEEKEDNPFSPVCQ